MSLSNILSQDITTSIEIPSDRLSLSLKEKQIVEAYENEAWLSQLNTHNDIVEKKFMKVDRNLLFQILMIENVGYSKSSQVDDLKAKYDPKNQRMDRVRQSNNNASSRNYQIITQVNVNDDDDENSNNGSNTNFMNTGNNNNKAKNAVYKLSLQSKTGAVFFAINSTPLPWISCPFGAKIIIRPGTIFNRGVFMLQESNVTFLGGINKKWNEHKDHKINAYLQAKLERDQNQVKQTGINTKKRKASQLS
ncbi:hypothetical protein Kpol_1007p13 [Vanderwaltozyma polyspora DSM 70294]|uniref:RecQ mediated genome instability protein 1 OB-fold domain-containing protein n=1 Tax=Vanderwaltozyma polyspora (strain ATCC 22028 / DSM 70294 / BCRC 21397 / CBS 2163 / NBRC 10782 / NRRL Y-8283 / UCD 57-17) TaxID=436907 RepID=A7TRT5_VANPO|nr:uncharacterized protein Kpol_1007p13 [Vanderwaltozyma polyspora DSM 70294]EDO15029.1 hypothetical protein Kpol_1007p13 [Vanderwaltozyma polyspora DSM 70294]